MVKHSVYVNFIELIETTDDKHHEQEVFSETFPFYPSYKEGELLFLQYTQRGAIDPILPLTRYIIVEIHHSISAHKKGTGKFDETHSTASMEIYVRKAD